MCGGTIMRQTAPARMCGLSPRVRGNLPFARVAIADSRSIPACAGEPPVTMPAPAGMKVYPRVCGGTAGRAAGATLV